jgi:ribose/xylose/arabinose/galactoside ABC-type transport system permease subunit
MKKNVPNQVFSFLAKTLRTYPVLLILIIFFAGFAVLYSDRFLTQVNVSAMIRQFVTLMLFAAGPSMVMTMGSLDLSYVGIWMLGGIFVWFLYPLIGLPAILVFPLLGLLTGLMIGVIQAKARIPSFILTLSVMITYWGLTALLSGGYPRSVDAYAFLTADVIPGIPTEILWTIPILIAAIFLIKRTVLGTYFYSIASNEEGAHLAGINVNKYKIMAFTVSGLFTGIGGIILFQHLGGSVPVELNLNTMNWPLVAIILGGTPLMGGSGGPQRTILGAVTLTVLIRGLNIAMLDPEAIQLLVGLMLIASILVGSRSLNKGGVEVT